MILSALVNRYEEASAVPLGWQKREASYTIDLSHEGELLGISTLGDANAKKPEKLPMILPTIGKGRSGKKAYETAYFLCDNADFMLGLDPKKFESARKLHIALLENVDSLNARAIKAYFACGIPALLPGDADKIDTKFNYVFSVNGKRVDYDDGGVEIRQAWDAVAQVKADNEDEIRCLVTGKTDSVIKLHYKVGLRSVTMGAQPFIAMNNQTSFRSYGAGTSDPPADIGQYAAFAYATALNGLLKDERHCQYSGDDAMVFWAEKGGEAEESLFADIFAPAKADEDSELADIMARIAKGDKPTAIDMERKFYLLCLSPNAARISIRFFHTCAFGDLICNIGSHYNRLSIVHDGRTPFNFLPTWLILSETTIKKSAKDAHPLLSGQLLYSVITGGNYPFTLYHAILTRIRAGEDINKTKAAVIKAVLIKNFKEEEVTTMALNELSTNKPYILGRLFSVLERLQERANGTATIRERYFSSACANPRLVFPTLLNLSMHHAAKLDNAVFYEKLKGTLLERLDDDVPFPPTFGLEEQGKFILGYYHQTQAFFTKKTDGEVTKDE